MATKKQPPTKTTDPNEVLQHQGDPWSFVKPVGELSNLERLKVLLYGPSGSGKSRAAARFKRPLIGLTEHQAVPTIRQANPNAMIRLIRNAADLASFRQLMRHPETANRCDAIILDSLTDAQRIIREHYTRRQSEKAGRDKTSMESWGMTIDATARLARELRDLPMHVCVICLDDESQVDGVGLVHRPSVSGKKLPSDLLQYFNAVGYVHLSEQARGLRHQVLFRGAERYLVKGMTGLNDLESPEPQAWVAKTVGDGKVAGEIAESIADWARMESDPSEDGPDIDAASIETEEAKTDPMGDADGAAVA